MNVDRKTRHLALLKACRAARHPDGNLLRAEDLAREWRKTGLRQADLDSALREAIDHGHLIFREGVGRTYELTRLGFWGFTLDEAILLDVFGWFTLIRAKARTLIYSLRGRRSLRPAHDRRVAGI